MWNEVSAYYRFSKTILLLNIIYLQIIILYIVIQCLSISGSVGYCNGPLCCVTYLVGKGMYPTRSQGWHYILPQTGVAQTTRSRSRSIFKRQEIKYNPTQVKNNVQFKNSKYL